MVAMYFIRGVVAALLAGMIWWVGNVILYAPNAGVAEVLENLQPGYFYETDAAIRWFWAIFPLVLLVGAVIYVIYGALRKEPYPVE